MGVLGEGWTVGSDGVLAILAAFAGMDDSGGIEKDHAEGLEEGVSSLSIRGMQVSVV